ncbi:MAG: phenylalanine--tRNA ligase subunit beta [Candidatus Omnitrophota bacterium]|nr:phenylalanine--tRNA ligase subunit beta [Candidatus Omnitrophota bacterium]MBU1929004.1 phenylalanine--tRNA ligase subunit beta [Candidatus Omnitrophota bacterium]MBU2035681.1 phenylalanine--tRNA ligase subunit beta [Candidatus Omnitrophota bacterium]MBU2221067.1 phenylalanine--tRNA ligase subunit beta [Candidatus Omnitrophota bacterium]MBU2258845.1 phenylalanine--tRNA ligase subunit beta [Candidatus Omnitrophota bacterium]
MKFTYNWLKDFVDIRLPAEELADKLTMAGLEVRSLEAKDGDFVFDIEITSNRPDWLSVVGVAREAAAITNSKLKIQSLKSTSGSQSLSPQPKTSFKIEIEDKKDCPLYTAKIIRDVKIRPSPEWLSKRLEMVGCRSVNNIVDIINYIMFTYGEPMHAFDLDKLDSDKIFIRRAKKYEKITSIDDQERVLEQDILVIADKEKPVAIAGIMGGKDTEVDGSTKNVLLEAAIFNLIVIRQGKRKLGMQSESAYRFERGIDYETARNASWQATRLIEELCAGKCVLAEESGLPAPKKTKVNLSLDHTGKLLGVNITSSRVKSILGNLGFAVSFKSKGVFSVETPLSRQDVKADVDLIEEIARVYGFENVPVTLPAVKPQVSAYTDTDRVYLIKSILISLGLSEIISYSLISKDLLKGMGQYSLVEIRNPLSKEQEVLRPTIIPGILKAIAVNLNQKQSFIGIFEISKIFSAGKDNPREDIALAIGISGVKSWLFSQGQIKDEQGLLHIKGIISTLLERLGINDYKFVLSPDKSVDIFVNKELTGRASRVIKETLDNFDIKNKEVFIAELYLGRIINLVNLNRKFSSLPVYPSISRDISVVVKKEISVDALLDEIKANAGALLREAKVIDYYQGKQIPDGSRGLTFSCVYRSEERTLTEEEVNSAHLLTLEVLKNKFQAQLR